MRHFLQWMLLLLVSLHGIAQAQTRVISGKITDAANKPLAGASIQLKNSAKGTTTNDEGEFHISVPGADAVLVISYTGYDTQEVPVGEQSAISLSLHAQSKSVLEDVVVVGYGTRKKSDVTGAVASVKAAELQQRPATNVEQMLAGRSAGVNIATNSGRPGGQTAVHIRGYTSISASNGPLYVVDGVIGVGNINYLNPNDIETIDVLKDASATAIYGARGANGVIMVTTKRGKKGISQVNYDSYYSIGHLPKELSVLNSQQFLQVEENSYNADNLKKYDSVGYAQGKYTDHINFLKNRNDPRFFDASGNPLYNTDWQKEATRNAFSHNQNLSFTGGNEKTTYGLFLNYANENGIILTSQLKRYSARFVFDSQVKDWLKVGGTVTFNHVEENRVIGDGDGSLSVTRMMIETLPLVPLKFADGTDGSNYYYPNMEGGINPVAITQNRRDIFKTQSTLGNIYANLNLLPGLQLRSSIGFDVDNVQEDFYSGRNLRGLSYDQQGNAYVDNLRNNYWQFENYLTYDKKIAHNQNLNALLGLSWQKFTNFDTRAGSQGFTDDFYQWNNLGAGARPQNPSSSAYNWEMNSYFGRVNYSIDNKYLFTVTGRADGSSKFGKDSKYGFFPSGAFAWKASDEDFLKGNPVISNLKFRTSYGLIGNSEIGAYQSLASLSTGTAIIGGNRVSTVGIGTLANPDLKWEKTSQADAGFELGLLKNRINLDVDFYYKKTSDMLLNVPVPAASGYETVYKNIGDMTNKGIELTLNTTNISTKDFTWNTTFNIALNKNKVTALGASNDDIFPDPQFITKTNVLRIGQPVGSFYGLIREGTWGTKEAATAAAYHALPGDIKYRDVNNDGNIDDKDRVILGKGAPDGYGTFLNTFSYKNFDLAVEIQYSYGNDVLNLTRHSGEDRTGQANSYTTVLDGWTPDHQNTMIAQNRPAQSYYATTINSRMIEDGSFIRGKNLLLGYNFSKRITDKLKFSRLRVYASVQNFFLSTKFTGYDPEVTTYPGAPFAQGISFFDYPKPRTFLFGVNVGF
ncbi:TonB-dependent receptor [Deminuibacter soli]|uniref:TonB-dependent receptor n=2 Tax=Deminuibacter soli TaxID=2291815 RepID=A0A3E1NRP1_9BACT|nr:TonB-dependent receptor [Deminuibacter soli]